MWNMGWGVGRCCGTTPKIGKRRDIAIAGHYIRDGDRGRQKWLDAIRCNCVGPRTLLHFADRLQLRCQNTPGTWIQSHLEAAEWMTRFPVKLMVPEGKQPMSFLWRVFMLSCCSPALLKGSVPPSLTVIWADSKKNMQKFPPWASPRMKVEWGLEHIFPPQILFPARSWLLRTVKSVQGEEWKNHTTAQTGELANIKIGQRAQEEASCLVWKARCRSRGWVPQDRPEKWNPGTTGVQRVGFLAEISCHKMLHNGDWSRAVSHTCRSGLPRWVGRGREEGVRLSHQKLPRAVLQVLSGCHWLNHKMMHGDRSPVPSTSRGHPCAAKPPGASWAPSNSHSVIPWSPLLHIAMLWANTGLASFFSFLFWMATELQNAAPSLQEVKLSSALAVNSLRANRIVMVIVTVAMLMLLIVTACVYPALSVHNILSFTSTVIPWNSHHLGP